MSRKKYDLTKIDYSRIYKDNFSILRKMFAMALTSETTTDLSDISVNLQNCLFEYEEEIDKELSTFPCSKITEIMTNARRTINEKVWIDIAKAKPRFEYHIPRETISARPKRISYFESIMKDVNKKIDDCFRVCDKDELNFISTRIHSYVALYVSKKLIERLRLAESKEDFYEILLCFIDLTKVDVFKFCSFCESDTFIKYASKKASSAGGKQGWISTDEFYEMLAREANKRREAGDHSTFQILARKLTVEYNDQYKEALLADLAKRFEQGLGSIKTKEQYEKRKQQIINKINLDPARLAKLLNL